MKRVSETIESVGYLYADSAENAFLRLPPVPDKAIGDPMPWEKVYRVRFVVEPVED